MIDDCYVNKLAKNQVSAVFHLSVIRSVSPKFIELCMETRAMFVPFEGTQTWQP